MATLVKSKVCKNCKCYIKKHHNCAYCGNCHRYCNCRKRAGYVKVFNAHSAAIGSSSIFLNSKRAIGIELELSNWGNWYVEKKRSYILNCGSNGFRYDVVHDGSVTPSTTEAVFHPVAGDQQIINLLNTLANQVYTNRCEVNTSCGYHIHVNAQDFGWHEIQKLLTLWVNMESQATIFKIAGRAPNAHCLTWSQWIKNNFQIHANATDVGKVIPKNIKDFKRFILQCLYGRDPKIYELEAKEVRKVRAYKAALEKYKMFPKEYDKPRPHNYLPMLKSYLDIKANRGWNHAVASRYLNLNIHSWKYRGTVEYRLGAGTVNIDDIRMWPIFCLWLTEAASRTSMSCIEKFYSSRRVDIINKFIKDEGIIIPSINGPTVYPLPKYIKNWLTNKIEGNK